MSTARCHPPDGTHTVVITAASGSSDSVLLLGFRVRQASGISFDNLAVKYGIAAYNQEHDAGDLTGRAVAEDYSSDADVLWIALGANDIGMGRTPSQIVADITALRNRWSSEDCRGQAAGALRSPAANGLQHATHRILGDRDR
ncbi:hypothetical protein [Mycolicibacterium llatzerense]|uniref:hypothetical protein n=1 Tax=Mycolicibacterium llatzerense TaxID=280871 RepID=UPI0021B661AB|nr:hypothetical protein [Mycolicibacterium llatzerense]